ncbi:hypothetical protein [Laspinema olomoucense]|uniref:Uncharacterized protein n=1 Tax=Laspinema olomoucense D3b TaxID=2953688 RepID=A0ABT2NFC0_9CYAN|nr:hypothetical protein [Laspinema sp. D3b]MCT7981394.1 hypothetical protein [Laspinema sp. D3b]
MNGNVNLQIIKSLEGDNQLSECTLFYQNTRPCIIVFQNAELGNHQFEGKDVFDGFCELRLFLEKKGWNILCNGARVDAYPSSMSRDMGGGMKLYHLQIGKRPQRSDLLRIFDKAEPNKIGTIEEQRLYYERWRASEKSE